MNGRKESNFLFLGFCLCLLRCFWGHFVDKGQRLQSLVITCFLLLLESRIRNKSEQLFYTLPHSGMGVGGGEETFRRL